MSRFFSKKILIGLVATLSLISSAYAATGFLKGERTDGMNKICYYDVLGSTYTLNVSSVSLCPLTHNF
ncbi:hypothetical protein EDC45_1908 [Mesocricetibacter intestinalis]|uniref:Uncharacterized protein n=1 Tax=Mesocricetibacter intestinalis TaxID=1521930 RepID=A0A4R6V9Z9_9PAST|nr:hypothetical protein EDC45_1908 [Mesocricetibacter intestinalis]